VLQKVQALSNPNVLSFVAAHEDVSATTGLPRLTIVTELCTGGEVGENRRSRGLLCVKCPCNTHPACVCFSPLEAMSLPVARVFPCQLRHAHHMPTSAPCSCLTAWSAADTTARRMLRSSSRSSLARCSSVTSRALCTGTSPADEVPSGDASHLSSRSPRPHLSGHHASTLLIVAFTHAGT